MCRKLLYKQYKFTVDITEVGMFVMNYIFIYCIYIMLEHDRF